MQRRNFLKFLSLSSILALGKPTTLLSTGDGRFKSEAFEFTFSFPPNWQTMTALDDVGHYLAEWGGHEKDHTPPLILLSKYKEPTSIPNHEFRVYALEQSDTIPTTIDAETATETFKYISSQREEIFNLNTLVDSTMCPWSAFTASWRSKGIDDKYDFLGHFFLLPARPCPLMLVTCQPRTADDSDLVNILKSFRSTA